VIDEADDFGKKDKNGESEAEFRILQNAMSKGVRTMLFSATYDESDLVNERQYVKPGYYLISVGIMNAVAASLTHSFVPVSFSIKIRKNLYWKI